MMDTYQRIIETAITVLNEDFSASFEDIAIKCGLNRRTLHRYFKSRHELLEACHKNMMQAWERVAIEVYNSSEDPLIRLEHLLYAGIDSGTKYTFLIKLNEASSLLPSYEAEKNAGYLNMRKQLFSEILELQKTEVMEEALPLPWIRILFISVITATVTAFRSGDIAPNDIKRLAWYSFRKSIGIK